LCSRERCRSFFLNPEELNELSQYRIVGDGFAADLIEKNPDIDGSSLIALVLHKAYRQIKQEEAMANNG